MFCVVWVVVFAFIVIHERKHVSTSARNLILFFLGKATMELWMCMLVTRASYTCSQTLGDHSSSIILQDCINGATYKKAGYYWFQQWQGCVLDWGEMKSQWDFLLLVEVDNDTIQHATQSSNNVTAWLGTHVKCVVHAPIFLYHFLLGEYVHICSHIAWGGSGIKHNSTTVH